MDAGRAMPTVRKRARRKLEGKGPETFLLKRIRMKDQQKEVKILKSGREVRAQTYIIDITMVIKVKKHMSTHVHVSPIARQSKKWHSKDSGGF